jgi:DNA repair protein RadC
VPPQTDRHPRSPQSSHEARRLLAWASEALDDAGLLSEASGLPAAACARLLSEVGSLAAVAALHPAELLNRHGIPARRAVGVAAAFELGRRAAASAAATAGWRVRSPEDVGERLVPAMRHLEREELRVLLLNTKNAVTGSVTVYVGNLAGSSVRVGEVFRDAVRRQAAAIVVVHNHPSGDPSPSAEDLRITAELAEAGRLLDIELLDHVVVGASGWVSLRAMGLTSASSPALSGRSPMPHASVAG